MDRRCARLANYAIVAVAIGSTSAAHLIVLLGYAAFTRPLFGRPVDGIPALVATASVPASTVVAPRPASSDRRRPQGS